MRVSIVLPTFNESSNIRLMIQAIGQELYGQGYDYEVLVVDDSSADQTAKIAKDMNKPWVKVIVREADFGFAKSIRCGIEHASGDVLVLMDSDFNHRPEDLVRLLNALGGADCVVASRFIPGGQMKPWWRSMASFGFNQFIRIATKSALTDHLFGFIAVKKSCLINLPFDEIFYGFGDYSIRLLYHLQRRSIKVIEVPGVYGRRLSGQGNKRLVKTFIKYVRATLAVARQHP
jgi:dolichol-phosphate mannosyltransferase